MHLLLMRSFIPHLPALCGGRDCDAHESVHLLIVLGLVDEVRLLVNEEAGIVSVVYWRR